MGIYAALQKVPSLFCYPYSYSYVLVLVIKAANIDERLLFLHSAFSVYHCVALLLIDLANKYYCYYYSSFILDICNAQ